MRFFSRHCDRKKFWKPAIFGRNMNREYASLVFFSSPAPSGACMADGIIICCVCRFCSVSRTLMRRNWAHPEDTLNIHCSRLCVTSSWLRKSRCHGNQRLSSCPRYDNHAVSILKLCGVVKIHVLEVYTQIVLPSIGRSADYYYDLAYEKMQNYIDLVPTYCATVHLPLIFGTALKNVHANFNLVFVLFCLRAKSPYETDRQSDGRTDERTGNTHNAAY